MAEPHKKKYDSAAMAVVTGIRDLFKTKEVCGELKETDRLDGKTVFIDGASSGLGFAIAVDVAKRGARVIMACRSGIPEKGKKVKMLSGNPNVHMLQVDLADLKSISDLVSRISDQFPLTDIFILNAGIVPKKSRKTPQGLEEMFMVNYFAKFTFIRLLIENGLICDTGYEIRDKNNSDPGSRIPNHASRIIFVTSESHRNPEKFDWKGFGKYKEYGIKQSMELYGYYKLLLVTFSRELSRRLNPAGKVNTSIFAMCPGPVNSNIAREAPKIFHPLLKLIFAIFFKSPKEAAKPVVYLAASPDVEGKPFDYLFLMSRQEIDEKAADPENGERLWEVSERLLKIEFTASFSLPVCLMRNSL
ncbi:MAG: SDR family NAD(P)-dependent oxidoreductase [Bacteroidales bacterium]|nr:SDR family NAD(P)-dependent oxidoreductase [Bacteroidales bacterium]